MVERLFLAVPQGCLRFVIVVFPDHIHILFLVNSEDPNKMPHLGYLLFSQVHISQCLRFQTMWYVRPAKPQISLCIRAVCPEPLLVA